MLPAQRLGRYELLGHLANGGMSRLYLARLDGHAGFARHVVLKTLRPGESDDPAFVSMFLDEARLVAQLHHQHVAHVYEFGVADDGTYYLAMEYLHGETVRAVLDRARAVGYRLPLDFALTVVCAAAAGLHHAHEQCSAAGRPLGIVHRDVTPVNLIAGYDGAVKLIDFGIAKATVRSTQTLTGVVKGKPSYMSPEQARGYPIDRRSDVFSLGIVLYELTTQTEAFGAPSDLETLQRIINGELTPPSRRVPGFPPELEQIVLTTLATDADRRFQEAERLRRALEGVGQRLGLRLGESTVTRVLADLFGPRPEPWRGLARGSDSHDAVSDDEEEDSTTLRYVSLESDEPLPVPVPAPVPVAVSVPPRRRNLGRIALLVAFATLGTGLLAMALRSDGEIPLALRHEPPPPPPPIQPIAPVPVLVPAAAAVAPPPPPPPTPTRIVLRVTTHPDDATVVLDGVRLGRSPITLTLPVATDEVVLKVRKRGYRSKRSTVTLQRDLHWEVWLSAR
jgi:serine/threonine-protein kinase